MVLDAISSNINEVFLINSSANVFVFENCNVHLNDWQTCSGRTDRPGELCYNFSILNNLIHMVNVPTWIPDYDSCSPALLDLFISFGASIYSTMAAFPPLRNSNYVVVSVFIEILSNSKGDAPFHQIAYDYFCGYLDGLCDHLRDVPWEYIFKLSASAVTS